MILPSVAVSAIKLNLSLRTTRIVRAGLYARNDVIARDLSIEHQNLLIRLASGMYDKLICGPHENFRHILYCCTPDYQITIWSGLAVEDFKLSWEDKSSIAVRSQRRHIFNIGTTFHPSPSFSDIPYTLQGSLINNKQETNPPSGMRILAPLMPVLVLLCSIEREGL